MEADDDDDLASVARDFLHSTILDSELTVDEKRARMSQVIDRGDADIGRTLGDDDSSLGGGGVFPLLLAVNVGDAELVEFLVDRAADVNQSLEEPHFGQAVCPTALHQACLDGRLDLVQILIEHDGVCPPSGRHRSSSDGSSCPFCVDLELTNARGQTPFHLAVESGNSDLVRYLVEDGGCRIDAIDANGNNALHMTTCIAPDRSALDMVDVLMRFGVSTFHRNCLGFSPVKLAMLLGRDESARFMLASIPHHHGQRLREAGFHSLEAAVIGRRRRTIASLLDRPSGIASTDESLHLVVLNSRLNGILAQLLGCRQMRALIDANGSLGFTPLYSACAGRNADAVRMLLDAGADPDRPSQRQHDLPLKKAILLSDLPLSRLLLDYGASACHCSNCSPLLRRRHGGLSSTGGPQAALLGIRDGELDLLYLALFTDISICRLLVAGGTCVSSKALQVMTASEHRIIRVDLYRAGLHGILRAILSTEKSSDPVDDDISAALLSPPPLQLLSRTVLRGVFGPRVYWFVQKLSLPRSISSYLLLET